MSEDSTRALLFVDLLGAKSVWIKEGAKGAAAAFARFADAVETALDEADFEGVLSAAVESDSAAVLCEDGLAAVTIGASLYQAAFFAPSVQAETVRRTWIRGVVVPAEDHDEIETLRTIEARDEDGLLRVAVSSHVLLDAVSMEKSG
jgi:hypothetical protein